MGGQPSRHLGRAMSHTGEMVPRPLDEVEFVRLVGAPFAGDKELRDVVEMVVNGERLSELLGGLPLDACEVGGLADAWLWGGHDVTVGRCVCSSVGCIRAEAEIVRRGPVVEWVLSSIGRKFRFDGADLERELRQALARAE